MLKNSRHKAWILQVFVSALYGVVLTLEGNQNQGRDTTKLHINFPTVQVLGRLTSCLDIELLGIAASLCIAWLHLSASN